MRLVVRPCRRADVARLDEWAPTGLTRGHARRFARQQQGLGSLLVAWLDDAVVVSLEVRWDGCAAPEVQERLGRCPEINGVLVRPEELRSRGIGRGVLRAAEQLARSRGLSRIGLGVDDGNPRAAALYLRLGYRETGCRYLDRYSYVSPDGVTHEVADPCRFLVKPLDVGMS